MPIIDEARFLIEELSWESKRRKKPRGPGLSEAEVPAVKGKAREREGRLKTGGATARGGGAAAAGECVRDEGGGDDAVSRERDPGRKDAAEVLARGD